jgi:hypothetical protein
VPHKLISKSIIHSVQFIVYTFRLLYLYGREIGEEAASLRFTDCKITDKILCLPNVSMTKSPPPP